MYEYGVLEALIIELLTTCRDTQDWGKDWKQTTDIACKIFDYCQNHKDETSDVITNLEQYIPDKEHDLKSKVDRITITIEQLKSGKKTTINI